MGAWGTGSFENDMAADWGGDLAEDGTPETVRETLIAVAQTPRDAYLESPEASEALAAAEVVAAAAGRPVAATPYSENALAWADRHPEIATAEFLSLARAAVDRVSGAESELRELWLDAAPDDARGWADEVADLRRRLGG
jgi:hypothetical protein